VTAWVRWLGRLDGIADRVLRWDEAALRAISESAFLKPFSRVFVLATVLGDGYLWGGLALGLLLFGQTVDRYNVLIGCGVSIVNIAVFRFLKLAFARSRPALDEPIGLRSRLIDSYAFPSGHAATSFGLAWLVQTSYPRIGIGIVVYAAATVIALSRVYMREHYPLDVLFGAALGTAVASSLYPFFHWLFL
jgi:undecaprenyl-diphosphatase